MLLFSVISGFAKYLEVELPANMQLEVFLARIKLVSDNTDIYEFVKSIPTLATIIIAQ